MPPRAESISARPYLSRRIVKGLRIAVVIVVDNLDRGHNLPPMTTEERQLVELAAGWMARMCSWWESRDRGREAKKRG